MADEHRRLRLEDGGALLPVDRGHGSADEPADDDPAVGARRRRLVPHRRHARASWAPANEVVMGANGLGFQVTHAEQGGLNKVGIQLHPRVLGPRHPHLGRPHPLQRSGVALHQRAPGSSTSSRSRSWRARSGRVSSRTTSGCGSSSRSRRRTSSAACGATERCSAPTRARPTTSKCDAETSRPGHRGRAGRLRDRDRAGEAGRVRDLPAEPVHRRDGFREPASDLRERRLRS